MAALSATAALPSAAPSPAALPSATLPSAALPSAALPSAALPPAEIVACETCGGKTQLDAEGRTRGENLLLQLRAALASTAALPVTVSSVRCLWACKRSCAVAVRSASRVGYIIADLEPTEPTAQALLDYAARYARTADGAVPFREWPALLKGHFLCRFPKAAELPSHDFPDAELAPPTPDEPAGSKNEQLP